MPHAQLPTCLHHASPAFSAYASTPDAECAGRLVLVLIAIWAAASGIHAPSLTCPTRPLRKHLSPRAPNPTMSTIPDLVDSTARTLYGDTIDLTKSNGDLRAEMFGHRRGALDAKSSLKMSRIIALRELCVMAEDKLTPIVESLHDEIEEKHASEKRARIK
eukprot:363194-Chlamydomonas_euryale.AAC.4